MESCLNSRPLYDSLDPNPLTSAHFLIGEALTSLPEDNLQDVPKNHLDKYQQHFWNRWPQEYTSQLQVRTKWNTAKEQSSKTDVLVLIKDDGLSLLTIVYSFGKYDVLF